MGLEELKEKITDTIKLYEVLIDRNRLLINKLKADKKQAEEELQNVNAALDLEKKIMKAQVELLAYIDAQVRLKSLLK